jgi:hypothetical protein
MTWHGRDENPPPNERRMSFVLELYLVHYYKFMARVRLQNSSKSEKMNPIPSHGRKVGKGRLDGHPSIIQFLIV